MASRHANAIDRGGDEIAEMLPRLCVRLRIESRRILLLGFALREHPADPAPLGLQIKRTT
jgi:hypothetical protein